MMMHCDEMAWCLKQMFPALINGRDYWVAHPVDLSGGTPVQSGDAWIVKWIPKTPTEPTLDQVHEFWTAHGSIYRDAQVSAAVRAQRDELLDQAGHQLEVALDRGDTEKEKAIRAYRQQLRDVPLQSGFPHSIAWPTNPN